MAHGIRVWTNDNPPKLRLEPGDKQVMHYAYYSGTLLGGGSATATITVGGGYDISSGDWGMNVIPVNYFLEAESTTNTITVRNKNPAYNTSGYGSIQYRVSVFKLNQ